jgi:hypothetical protein
MFVVQNNGPASHLCIRQTGDDSLIQAGGPAGWSVSGADPRGIRCSSVTTLETWDGPRLENRVRKGVRPAHEGKDSPRWSGTVSCV